MPPGTSPTWTRSACPGGFGIRGIEGKLGALTYARTHRIPTLGLCLGLQCMVIEYARNVAGLTKAASTEFDPQTPEPVIATMAEQQAFVEGAGDLGGTMRLGLYPAELKAGTVVRDGLRRGQGRRSGTGTATRSTTPTATSSRTAGLVFSGTSPDDDLVEFVELPREVHPYYVSTQAHPELRSRPTRPHPLFAGLVGAAIERQRELRFPIDECGLRREPPTTTSSGRWSAADGRAADRHAAELAGRSEGRARRPAPRRLGGGAARRPDPPARATPRRSRSGGSCSSTPAPSVVLAVDDDERVLCLRQYRHPAAVLRRAAGRAAATARGRSPLEVARRELREEAGAGGRPAGRTCATYSSPGISDGGGAPLPRPRS